MLKINGKRLLADLDALAQIGGTTEGGVSRPAMSAADVAGREWFENRARVSGLDVRRDGAGNLSAVLPADNPDSQTILLGSHLDSVPNGGKYDGALGVLAALEVLRTVAEADVSLPYHLEAVSFTDEEGAVYSMLGSQALTGALMADDLRGRVNQAAFEQGMATLSITPESILSAQRDPATIRAFLELHIEQGTRLQDAAINIGVVTSIVGIRHSVLRFYGEAAHAGTMPMNQRRDALWGAAVFIQRAREMVMGRHTPGVMNCGQIAIPNSAANIVPAHVELTLEFRHGTNEQLDAMERDLLALAETCADEYQLDLRVEPKSAVSPAAMDTELIAACERAASKHGLTHTRLLSLAGHDTQMLCRAVPGVLLFVPSVDGISHNPREFTPPADVVNGANVLLQTALEIAAPSLHN